MKQQEWVLTRKRLLRQLKAQVRGRLGETPASLRLYAKKLTHEFRGRWRACPLDELMKAVASSDVVFGSDFHAYAQSQRAHLRVLRSLPSRRRVVLMLECLCAEDQACLDDFLAGRLTEDEFLQEIQWQVNWGFPWVHYRPVLEMAKERGYAVRGLSRRSDARSDDSLGQRDVRMAKDIARVSEENAGALVYVLVGEMHLANAHLPEAWEQLTGTSTATVIFQDAEELYFRLAEKAKDTSVEVLRSGHRFCLMVSPPWMKWQSYLMYLEQAYDSELNGESDEIDFSDHIRSFVDWLARDFQLSVNTSHLQVYTPISKEVLKQLKRQLPRRQWPVLLYHLSSDRSFLLPQKGLIYLSNPTLNRAAALAGEFLHAQLSGQMAPLWDGLKSIEAQVWVESVGFFFSKWINPKRKPERLENIKRRLSVLSPRDRGRAALALALDQRMSDVIWQKTGRRRTRRTLACRISDVAEAARMLGSILGDRLFLAVRDETISRDELVEWMQFPVDDPEFGEFYRSLLKRLA